MSTGAVRAMARPDRCRWVSTPRWARTSSNVTSTRQRWTNPRPRSRDRPPRFLALGRPAPRETQSSARPLGQRTMCPPSSTWQRSDGHKIARKHGRHRPPPHCMRFSLWSERKRHGCCPPTSAQALGDGESRAKRLKRITREIRRFYFSCNRLISRLNPFSHRGSITDGQTHRSAAMQYRSSE